VFIVVAAPAIQFFSGIGQAEEDLAIQAFIAQATVEAFDIPVLYRFAGPNQIQLHMILVGPRFHRSPRKLTSVVGRDRLGKPRRAASRLICTTTFSPLWERSA
jgi:hypothetical protein